jgi:hypothetical protein
MTKSEYPIHRAIGRPIQFKGLQGQYILIAAGGLIGDLFVFILLYCCGIPTWFCAPVVLGIGAAVLSVCMRFSRKYGVHGWQKMKARRRVPGFILGRSRKLFHR